MNTSPSYNFDITNYVTVRSEKLPRHKVGGLLTLNLAENSNVSCREDAGRCYLAGSGNELGLSGVCKVRSESEEVIAVARRD
ncbi:hypothetical protein JTB14_020809 [Gonioctena quinquepunctata]|nr:hypothetical protein JTB14_020809 [Gonioctena quinquepunctata]